MAVICSNVLQDVSKSYDLFRVVLDNSSVVSIIYTNFFNSYLTNHLTNVLMFCCFFSDRLVRLWRVTGTLEEQLNELDRSVDV